ncbi:MAG: Eco57I restriction-modification methylase domain-containing protein [Candidatus Marsarchaeota archaeon]|jgi:SAM-dependent methyltransferase|nr:Eco57I restriction-modification methylase domain-containing protein [Candidatus Marsarchaeota archaeon]MCL5418973.1 Eco57I restriction-modification methylase domain-containing protein [Candidatus Marsarchaeota archaeon]
MKENQSTLNSYFEIYKDKNSVNNKKENKIISDIEPFLSINDNYKDLKSFMDKLNLKNYHFVNSNDICTPMDLVEEMVNAIPNSFWHKKNLKILDPCAGNGNFPVYIAQKTKLQNIFLNEINKVRVENMYRIFGNDVNITEKDFLSFPSKEKYDLIVANPPYAKFTNGKRTAKNHNISRDFILKALDLTKRGGYILFVVPDNWMSFADNNKVPEKLTKYQFIYIDIHGAKKYFPKVGSSFTWFLLQKVPNKNEATIFNNYKIKSTEKAILDKGMKFIPLYYSNIVRSIINKTLNSDYPKYKIETSSYLHKYTQKDFLSTVKDDKHIYKLWHTPSQVVWSEKPHKYQDEWKVFISLTNQYKNFVDNCGMTQSIAFIRCKSKEEACKISNELNNELYIFLNNITRYGNFNNIRVLQHFPIFRDFNLTEEEIDFIHTFNKAYKTQNKKDK